MNILYRISCLTGVVFFITLVASRGQSSITITQAPSASCDSGQYVIGINTTGSFDSGNLFLLELSEYGGSFTNAIVIDTLAATGGGNLFFQGTFPALFTGNYRLRVRSSSPIEFSAPVTMAATQLEHPQIHGSNSIMVLVNAAPNHVYQWYRSGRPVGAPNSSVINSGIFGRYFVQASLPGCPGRSVFSNVFALNPSIDSLFLESACVGETRQWYVGLSGGRFEPGNVIEVELSDSNGLFGTTNTVVGRSVGVTYPSRIALTFPDSLLGGTGYRLRLKASNPVYLSPPTPAFTLRARPSKPIVQRWGDTLFTSSAVSYQWKSIANNFLPNAKDSFFLPQIEGHYFVTIQDSFCTSLPSDTVAFFFTNTQEPQLAWQIGPNPANEALRIMADATIEINNLQLLEVSGKNLAIAPKQINAKVLEISTSSLPNGIYFLKSGNKTYKFMVKH